MTPLAPGGVDRHPGPLTRVAVSVRLSHGCSSPNSRWAALTSASDGRGVPRGLGEPEAGNGAEGRALTAWTRRKRADVARYGRGPSCEVLVETDWGWRVCRVRRRLRTRGERIVVWSYTVIVSLFAPAGVVLLMWGSGAARSVGIALLVVGLVVMAVPISPFLRARVRRREADAERGQQ